MSVSIKSIHAVIATIAAGHNINAQYATRIATLRGECAGMARVEIVNAIMPHVAASYGMNYFLPSGKGKYAEQCTLDNTHASYEACRKTLSRIVRDVFVDAAASTTPAKNIRVKAQERAAFALFLEACGGDMKHLRAVMKACAK